MRDALMVGSALGLVWGVIQDFIHHPVGLVALVDIGAYGVAGAGAVCWAWLLWRLVRHYWHP